MTPAPLVVHLIYRLDFGGLEMLLADCINRMPPDRYRHAIVCLTDYTDFSKKIVQPGVQIFALNKPPGLGLSIHFSFWKLLRKLRPAILHTYNLSALEYSLVAALAGVPVRIHAVHGREMSDPQGTNRKHNVLRRALIPLNHCFVPVSGDLQRWLKTVIRVPDEKNVLISNGVDTDHFSPDPEGTEGSAPDGKPAWAADCFIVGTVGRVQDIKNHDGLVDAFIQLRAMLPEEKSRLRLVIVGDGPLLSALREKVERAGIGDAVWMPGARTDIASILKSFTVFALPSIAEGTPVAVLEAMSAGLPIVASRVGGLPEIVGENVSGLLVPPSDVKALASALAFYCSNPEIARAHGLAGRNHVEKRNSTHAMVLGYAALYDRLYQSSVSRKASKPCVE